MPTDASPVEPASLLRSDPRRVGPYRLLGRIGVGGMGVVYLGETDSAEVAAVKVVREELAHEPAFRTRFAREVLAAGTVTGVHTARVLHADTEATPQWVAIEYVPGPTLAQHVGEHGPVPEPDLHRLATALGQAIDSIHTAGLVHRDLKPSNVILGPNGPMVIDFGIARSVEATMFTQTGTSLGSLAWMAPEQITGTPTTAATDLFAWGLLIGYAALGRHPHGDGPPEAIAYRILNNEPDLTGLPHHLTEPVRAALHVDPTHRPPTCQHALTLTPENHPDHNHRTPRPAGPEHRTRVDTRSGTPHTHLAADTPTAAVHVDTPRPKRHRRTTIALTTTGLLTAALVTTGGIAASTGLLPLPTDPPETPAGTQQTKPAAGSTPVDSTTAEPQVVVPTWTQGVTISNSDAFGSWLHDHEGTVVKIDATLAGEPRPSGEYSELEYLQLSTWEQPSEDGDYYWLHVAPSVTGQPGYTDTGGRWVLDGYYTVDPMAHFTGGSPSEHYIQAVDPDDVEGLVAAGEALDTPRWDGDTTASELGALRDWLQAHTGKVVRIESRLDPYGDDPEGSVEIGEWLHVDDTTYGRPNLRTGGATYWGLAGHYRVTAVLDDSSGYPRQVYLQPVDTYELLTFDHSDRGVTPTENSSESPLIGPPA